jgi:hypothetical protein
MKCIACPRNECASLIYCTNLLHELKFCTEISVLSALNEVQPDPGMSPPLPSLLSCLVRRREASEVCLPLRFKRRKLAYQSSSLMHEKSKRSGVVAHVYGVGGGLYKGSGVEGRHMACQNMRTCIICTHSRTSGVCSKTLSSTPATTAHAHTHTHPHTHMSTAAVCAVFAHSEMGGLEGGASHP